MRRRDSPRVRVSPHRPRGAAGPPLREGRARARRYRPATLRGRSPVPAGIGLRGHTGTIGEGMTWAERHRRGWGMGDRGTPVPSGMGKG